MICILKFELLKIRENAHNSTTIEIETEHQVKKVEQPGNNPGADDKPAVLELTTIKHNDDKDTPVVTKP